jgi:hypothetical protein
MHCLKLLIVSPLLVLLAACGPKAEESALEEAILVESQQLIGSLKEALSAELKAALQSGGVPAAIEVCRKVADPITAEVSADASDVHISRTALRFRNPGNAPDADSRAILEQWEAHVAETGQTPEPVVTRTEASIIVHAPIRLETNCLTCHGEPESFAPEVSAALARLYPEDQAVGFKVGDLRGAFRVAYGRSAAE